MKKVSISFFEKTKQKTLALTPYRSWGIEQTKAFWFFFSKKNCFLP